MGRVWNGQPTTKEIVILKIVVMGREGHGHVRWALEGGFTFTVANDADGCVERDGL